MTVKGVTETRRRSRPRCQGHRRNGRGQSGHREDRWDDKLPSSPYGAATVTNNVVFTTTYSGFLYAFNAATGAILLKTPLSAGSNSPVASTATTSSPARGCHSGEALIIAYKLGANGKLPDTVH